MKTLKKMSITSTLVIVRDIGIEPTLRAPNARIIPLYQSLYTHSIELVLSILTVKCQQVFTNLNLINLYCVVSVRFVVHYFTRR